MCIDSGEFNFMNFRAGFFSLHFQTTTQINIHRHQHRNVLKYLQTLVTCARFLLHTGERIILQS